jgi:uncharacterized membrane protein
VDIEQALRQIEQAVAELKAEIARMKAQPGPKTTTGKILLSKEDYTKLALVMHPDRWTYLNNADLDSALKGAQQIIQRLFDTTKQKALSERHKAAEYAEADRVWRVKRHEERLRRQAAALKAHARRRAEKAKDGITP